ncbi:unnamed protein product [Urochloa decumbens]|uniref:Uncharacterized protein n=1 Tax=Urochloa decumbens TaxID=240449 RepID=A0ABC8ZGR4_9POAL
MASPARHLFLVAVVAALAVAAEAWSGGRFFFSKTTRAEAAVEPEKAAAAAADTNAAPALSRPSTGGSGGRGYGLYGRPEENYPPEYFRRGVHRNAEKLTTTAGAGREAVPVAGDRGGERGQQYPEDGSGRGRPAPTTTTTTDTEEEAAPAGDLDGVQPYPENGSGRGRPPWYYTAFRGGRRSQQGQAGQRDDYGMSDTRLYQNGRYFYDVDAGRYGYGRESNPMRTRPEEYPGSGYGRPAGGAGGDRRGRYGENAAAGYRQYVGNDDEFGNDGAVDRNTNGFQEEGRQNGRYNP